MKKETKKSILVLTSSLVLGGVFFVGGSYLGNYLGSSGNDTEYTETTEVVDSEESKESKETLVTDNGFKEKTAKDFVKGEPKMEQESVIDRKEEPFNDGYKLDDSHLDYITKQEFKAKLDSGERFVIYVGRATCPYCHKYRPHQDAVLDKLDETIFSLDTEFYKNDPDVKAIRDNLGIEYVPTIAVIENGEIVSEMPEEAMQIQGTVQQWFKDNLK